MKRCYLIVALAVTSICMAMASWPNHPIRCGEPDCVQPHSIRKLSEKPKCSKVVNGTVCGGTLELSFTAYKKTTEKNCPFCAGKEKKGCTYCVKGKLWEWQSAYVCQTCKALYDVDVIQKQM